ncbi:MAG: sulfatase-like hydrolase/transferase [Hydrogenophilales bacterium]
MKNVTKPNVFFLLVDSFRADKFFGKEKTSITPYLDSLIKNGTYFSQAIGNAPVTIPNIACILTGKYPFNAIISGGNRYKLNPDVSNIATILKSCNYDTIALTPKILSLSGLTNDFDRIIDYPGHSGLYDGVGETIINIFEENKLKKPWFFYAHLLDLHGTSRGFPEKFNTEKYGMNQYERNVSAMDKWFEKIFKKINLENTLVVITADHGNDAGIYTPDMESDRNYVNHDHLKNSFTIGKKISSRLPKVLSPLKSTMRKVYLGKKVKVKTKRKNQKMDQINKKNLTPYEKRVMEHSIKLGFDVFDDRFRVPLLFTGFGVKSGKIISQQVRTIDIFPTICNIIKIPNELDVNGRNIFPLINGEQMEEVPAYLESMANWTEEREAKISDVVGIRYKNFKYFRSRNNPVQNIGIYDLNNDPLEENNLATKESEKIKEMEEILVKIQSNSQVQIKKESDELRDLEEEKLVEAELRKLGYL